VRKVEDYGYAVIGKASIATSIMTPLSNAYILQCTKADIDDNHLAQNSRSAQAAKLANHLSHDLRTNSSVAVNHIAQPRIRMPNTHPQLQGTPLPSASLNRTYKETCLSVNHTVRTDITTYTLVAQHIFLSFVDH